MIRINNAIINPAHILYVIQEQDSLNRVRMVFDVADPSTKSLAALVFEGPEAGEVWKALDSTAGDWRGDL